ncbi:MAG: adenylate/guanylate cyclase domain-containing protein [Anaerolineales bacterium]|nr:adenylate/guanylate cyclase domain-containing protein [Anaerolineales bacterium]MBK8824975.1 adenylate/guanylate cyclase domain-containing protein [Anaerolineales bacterium]
MHFMLPESPLTTIENRLRLLLPAEMYASMWGNPSMEIMIEVHKHLRTLQRILHDYTSRQISFNKLKPGIVKPEWQYGTMMFTDLAGFTKLMEANSTKGREGAENLLSQLTKYFSAMIAIISKSGGDLVEFTGDALLVVFPKNEKDDETLRAVRAGLRMQRAMKEFAKIQTPTGEVTLEMRIGIHSGRFLTADIGTPRRMEHVLLGQDVQKAKLTESKGRNKRVNLSPAAYERIADRFRYEPGELITEEGKDKDKHYMLVEDDLKDEDLGEYEITPMGRRIAASGILFDKKEVFEGITELLDSIEPMASFIPSPVLSLLVESAAERKIDPDFSRPTIMFINFIGLPEAADRALPGEETKLAMSYSKAFSFINAVVESRGGVLKKVTYHLTGSDIVIYFGVPTAHTNDEMRAASAAVAIREYIMNFKAPTIGSIQPEVYCQIGINTGPAFVAEVGDPRGRREYNVLGDTVNTTARLMSRAQKNQIIISEHVQKAIEAKYECSLLGEVSLKGKSAPMALFELTQKKPKK